MDVYAPYTLGTLAVTGACGPEMDGPWYHPADAGAATAERALFFVYVADEPGGVCVATVTMPDGTALTKSVQLKYSRGCDITVPMTHLEFP
ncbi:MAG: hypothetical protein HY908_05375 [Myxococcales bacterium]|nr:hypothetical protein [Myxococcales bacterium]